MLNRGLCYYSTQDYDAALAAVNAALALHPDYALARKYRGKILREMGANIGAGGHVESVTLRDGRQVMLDPSSLEPAQC